MTTKNNVTKTLLRKYFNYDPLTGIVSNKIKRGTTGKIDQEVGTVCINKNYKFKKVKFFGKTYKLHRLVWIWNFGDIPEKHVIDHLDHDACNNKLNNLRCVTQQENKKNNKLQHNNSSGCNGVYYDSKKGLWVSYIQHTGKRIYVGSSKDKSIVIKKRKKKERELGFHVNHGKE